MSKPPLRQFLSRAEPGEIPRCLHRKSHLAMAIEPIIKWNEISFLLPHHPPPRGGPAPEITIEILSERLTANEASTLNETDNSILNLILNVLFKMMKPDHKLHFLISIFLILHHVFAWTSKGIITAEGVNMVDDQFWQCASLVVEPLYCGFPSVVKRGRTRFSSLHLRFSNV
jgi:hypothetical protein